MDLRNGRIGIFDLGSSEMTEEEFSEGATPEERSSITVAESLSRKHGEESLVLGTGYLTGSFVPASSAGILRTSGLEGSPMLMPLLGTLAFELKMSGFDFVVIKGASERPGYLWIRDGNIDLVDAKAFRGLDSWARTDRIRAEQGDMKIQVLSCGPWCDAKNAHSQLVTNYWGGEDKVGMGAELGKKNLVAIAVRGMAELDFADPEERFKTGVGLMRGQLARLPPNKGLESYCGEVARDDFRSLVHRSVSCYGCPYPCKSFLADKTRGLGYLHYDVPAIKHAFAVGFDAIDATSALIACAKSGAEPVSLLKSLARGALKLAQVEESLKQTDHAGSSGTVLNFEESSSYSTCLGMGVCPRYWSKAGNVNDLNQLMLE